MHWRYRLRKQQLLDECEVPPEVFLGGIERLAEFARPFTECLGRREQKGHARTYLAGLVSDLGGTWSTGIEFGTVGVLVRGVRCEITTYRADRYDRISRNPQVAYGESLTDDLRRRDFTMNAMAVSLPGHQFADPYGGLRDLATGALRTPADLCPRAVAATSAAAESDPSRAPRPWIVQSA